MKVFQKNFFLFVFGVLALLSFAYLTLAAHIVTTSTGFNNFTSFNEDTTRFYNISINNSDAASTANITQVNITLPPGFIFTANTNQTDVAVHVFTNTSNTLSWRNVTYLINFTRNYFTFNATATNPGTFNITVITTNGTVSINTNFSITINDTTVPSSVEYGARAEDAGANISRTNIIANFTAVDNGVLDRITISLYNLTDLVNRTSSAAASSTFYLNFTGLANTVYTVNATVNDTFNRLNHSSSRTITVDTTVPLIDFNGGTTATLSNVSRSDIFINITVTETNEKNLTFEIYNSTSLVNQTNLPSSTRSFNISNLPDGTYTYNVTIYDYAENINYTTTRTVTIDVTGPTVTLTKTDSTKNEITVSISATDTTSGGVSCTLSSNEGTIDGNTRIRGLSCGNTYTITASCVDLAGSTGSDQEQFSTDGCGSGGSSGGSGSSSTSTSTWSRTISADSVDLVSVGQIKQQLGSRERVRIKVGGQSHSVGVLTVTSNSVTIEIASTPQQATLRVGEYKKADLDGDGYYDIVVTLTSIEAGKANVDVKAVHEQITANNPSQTTTGASQQNEPGSESPIQSIVKNNMMWVWIVALVLVAVVIAVLVVKKAKRRK